MPALIPIAHLHNQLPTKFGLPRQSNLVKELPATIVFEPTFRDANALRGLEGFSHLWLIWGFSELAESGARAWSPTVRPPRLGGNTRLGVFATRSPFRPNPLGLSAVRIAAVEPHQPEGRLIQVLGADLQNGTPIYDIKPYLPFCDSYPEARSGFASNPPMPTLTVRVDPRCRPLLPAADWPIVESLLAYDPRPAYQEDPERVYGLPYGEYDIRFTVCGDCLNVCAVSRRA